MMSPLLLKVGRKMLKVCCWLNYGRMMWLDLLDMKW